MSTHESVPGPYMNNDAKSFASTSAAVRWPAIITGAIDDVHRAIGELDDASGAKATEGKSIVEQIVKIKYSLQHDHVLEPLKGDAGDIAAYNEELAELSSSEPLKWHSAPWLYSECYLYRRIHTLFESSEHWKNYDVFSRQKDETFVKSSAAVAELAVRYKALAEQLETLGDKQSPKARALLKLLFSEFSDISLWGNATDLSLLVTVSLEDIQKLQGAESRKQNAKNVLANQLEDAWEIVDAEDGGRVDFVLDNAGFELYTDLVFALFLLDSGLADTIVLHPKSLPWFVSDVLPTDILGLFNMLQQPGLLPGHEEDAAYLLEKLIHYHSEGQLVIRSSPFWTSYAPFWDIADGSKVGAASVRDDLKDSKLVIFKGDLNYRKLVGDVMWPRTTPFTTAIRGLASSGIRVLTLRTVKADVAVGLPEGREAQLDAEWVALGHENPREWAYSGKYAVIQFSDGEA